MKAARIFCRFQWAERMRRAAAISFVGDKKQVVRQVFMTNRELRSNLGPDSAERPLKPWYKTQNRAKRFNRLDNRNCFGTRGSEVQILSPRPFTSVRH